MYADSTSAAGPIADFITAGVPIIPEVILLGKELILAVEIDLLLPGEIEEEEPPPPPPAGTGSFAIAAAASTGWIGSSIISGGEALVTGFEPPTQASSITAGTGGGFTHWTNPTNALASDDNDAAVARNTPGLSHWLYVRGFDFSVVPDGASVTGIDVLIERVSIGTVGLPRDRTIQITKDGSTVVGINKANTTLDWPTTDTVAEYNFAAAEAGNPTAVEVKSAFFGVMIQAEWLQTTTPNNVFARVDSVLMQVRYSQAGTPPPPGESEGVFIITAAATVSFTGSSTGGTGGSGLSFTTGFDSGFG